MIFQRDKIGPVIKHHPIETYGGLELELNTFLSRHCLVIGYKLYRVVVLMSIAKFSENLSFGSEIIEVRKQCMGKIMHEHGDNYLLNIKAGLKNFFICLHVSSFIYFFNGFPSLVGPGSFSVS
jgi:hypothetical protein